MKMDLLHRKDQIQTYDNIEYIDTHLLIYGPDILLCWKWKHSNIKEPIFVFEMVPGPYTVTLSKSDLQ